MGLGEYCAAHGFIEQTVKDIRSMSEVRDHEHETILSGVVARMDKLTEKMDHLEKRFDGFEDGLSTRISTAITAHIDMTIVRIFKTFWKWFFRVLVGGGILTILSILIRNIFKDL